MAGSSSLHAITLPNLAAVWHHASEDVFLICHIISQNHMIQASCDFMGGTPSR